MNKAVVMSERNSGFSYAAMRALAASAAVLIITFAATPVIAAKSSNKVHAEADIKDLHSKLKITVAQKVRWAKVAAVMRDNAKKLDELTRARITNATTAVEHINSYGVSAYAHADGIKKFASPWQLCDTALTH
jgi:hypothetical protein